MENSTTNDDNKNNYNDDNDNENENEIKNAISKLSIAYDARMQFFINHRLAHHWNSDIHNNSSTMIRQQQQQQQESRNNYCLPPTAIKDLILDWTHIDEFRFASSFYPPKEFGGSVFWKNFKHVESLTIVFFPHASMVVVVDEPMRVLTQSPQAATTETPTSFNNNNSIIKNNNGQQTIQITPPMSIGHLSTTLKELTFIRCHANNFHLPPNDMRMLGTNLTSLRLLDCEGIQTLPSDIGQLKHLNELILRNCPFFVQLPKEIGMLDQNLHNLEISDCPRLKELPIELNRLCKSLQILAIYGNNTNLQPLQFTFHIGHFIKLRELQIGWSSSSSSSTSSESSSSNSNNNDDDMTTTMTTTTSEGGERELLRVEMLMLQSLPTTSFEKLVLNGIDDNDNGLSILLHSSATTTTITKTSSLLLSRISTMLPYHIKEIYIKENYQSKIPINKAHQDVIHTLLQAYPRLSIQTDYNNIKNINLQQQPQNKQQQILNLGLFTRESIHVMAFNRCGRILLLLDSGNDSSSSSSSRKITTQHKHQERGQSPSSLSFSSSFPLSMWPMVLEQVSDRIGVMNDSKSKTILEASVIFSFLQGPAFMARPSLVTRSDSCPPPPPIKKSKRKEAL